MKGAMTTDKYFSTRIGGDDVARYDFVLTYVMFGLWCNFSFSALYPEAQFYIAFDIVGVIYILQKPIRDWSKVQLRYLAFSGLVGLTCFVALFAVSPFLSVVNPQMRDELYFTILRGVPSEELVFRGALFDVLVRLFSSRFSESNAMALSAVVSSSGFALYHIPRYGFSPGIMIYMLLLSLLCCVARRFGGLEASITVHRLNNAVAMFYSASLFGVMVI